MFTYVIKNDTLNYDIANERHSSTFAFDGDQKWHSGIKSNSKQEIIPQRGHTRLGTDLCHDQFGWEDEEQEEEKGVEIVSPPPSLLVP